MDERSFQRGDKVRLVSDGREMKVQSVGPIQFRDFNEIRVLCSWVDSPGEFTMEAFNPYLLVLVERGAYRTRDFSTPAVHRPELRSEGKSPPIE